MRRRFIFRSVIILSIAVLGVAACKNPVDGTEGVPADKPVVVPGARLIDLKVSRGSLYPSFSASRTEYSVSVENTVESITVTGTAADSGARISGNNGQSQKLNVGDNAIVISVTAADGAAQNYVVTVNRARPADDPSNADLSGLWLEGANLTPEFSPAITEYTAIFGRTTPSTKLSGAAANKGAMLSGDQGIPKTLGFGDTVMKVVVAAPDGKTTRTYTVTATRFNDATPPKLVDFTMTPTEIDSSKGDVTVGGTLIAEDDSGVRGVTLYMDGPDGERNPTVQLDYAKSTRARSVYDWSIVVKKGTRGGAWRVSFLELRDETGNACQPDRSEFVTTFVDKAPEGDKTPPKLIAFTLNQTEIDSSNADAVVTGTVIAEDPSKVRYVDVHVQNHTVGRTATVVLNEAKSTLTHCEYDWSVTIDKGMRGGEWTVDYVQVCDEEMNRGRPDLSGYPTKFVDKAPEGDWDPPTLVDFTVAPDTFDASSGDVTVTGTFTAEDASGVRTATLWLRGPDGEHLIELNRRTDPDIPATRAVYDWSLTIKKGTLGGVWRITTFEIADEYLNRVNPVPDNYYALIKNNAPAN